MTLNDQLPLFCPISPNSVAFGAITYKKVSYRRQTGQRGQSLAKKAYRCEKRASNIALRRKRHFKMRTV